MKNCVWSKYIALIDQYSQDDNKIVYVIRVFVLILLLLLLLILNFCKNVERILYFYKLTFTFKPWYQWCIYNEGDDTI